MKGRKKCAVLLVPFQILFRAGWVGVRYHLGSTLDCNEAKHLKEAT